MGQSAVPAGESTDAMLKGYIDNLDKLTQATTRNIPASEQALLDADRQFQPQRQELSYDIASRFLPMFTKLGTDVAGQEAMQRAGNDVSLLKGPGRELVAANLEAQKLADPEFYKQRGRTSDSLDMLYDSLDDPNEGLSGSERAEIERSTARTNQQRGIEAPTATSAVSAAMNFGQAGAARKAAKQQAINAAVQTAGQTMPALRSGVDVLQLTTGRPSQANTGVQRFGENQQTGGFSQNMGSQLLSQVGQNTRQNADINSKRRTAFDSVMGVMDQASSLAKAI